MAKKAKSPEIEPEPVSGAMDEALKAIEEKRNALIEEIRPKLLTNSQLKQGGENIRVRYEMEKGYAAVLPEINELGKHLGLRPIGLGHLRRD